MERLSSIYDDFKRKSSVILTDRRAPDLKCSVTMTMRGGKWHHLSVFSDNRDVFGIYAVTFFQLSKPLTHHHLKDEQ